MVAIHANLCLTLTSGLCVNNIAIAKNNSIKLVSESDRVGNQMATVTLQELLDKAEIEIEYLDQECSESNLIQFATQYCDQWRMIGHHLKLKKSEITAINNDYMTTDEKRVQTLIKWKDQFGGKATYKVLIEAFLSNKEVDAATRIIEWLKHQSNEKSHIEKNMRNLENEFSVIQQKYAKDQLSTTDVHSLKTQCSAFNPDILQEFICKTGNEECEQLMKSYMNNLQLFRSQTKLGYFKASGETLGPSPPTYTRFDVEFPDNWIDKTLEDLETFRLSIPYKPCFLTRIVIAESPTVVFSIPQPKEPPQLDSLANYLGTGQVWRVIIGGECVFPSKEKSTAERLLLACKNGGDVLAEKFLMSESVSENDLRYQDECGNSLLMLASLFGNAKTVSLLLRHKVDINSKNDNGQTALMLASEKGYNTIVEMLLDYRADIELEDKNTYTALTYAASGGHRRAVQTLVSHGAQVNQKTHEVATDPNIERILRDYCLQRDLASKAQSAFTGMLSGLMNISHQQGGVGIKHACERLFEGSPQQCISQFEDDSSQTKSESHQFPSMNSAFQVLLPVAKEWENIGLLLDVPDDRLRAIGSQYGNNERNCLREMLRAWFRDASSSHTWETLAAAVQEIDSDIAVQIMSKTSSPTLVNDTTVD